MCLRCGGWCWGVVVGGLGEEVVGFEVGVGVCGGMGGGGHCVAGDSRRSLARADRGVDHVEG